MTYQKKNNNQASNGIEKAYDYAVYLLSLQLRTEGEIREKLKVKKYSPEIADNVIQRLRGNHYIDDQRYAEVYLQNLKQYKNFGYYGIKKKLMEKKLPAAIIEATLADGLPVEEEIKIAKRLFKKEGVAVRPASEDENTNRYQTFDQESGKAKQKLVQKLKSRGFRGEIIAKLVL